MKVLTYAQFIEVIDRLNSFFESNDWQIGHYGGLPLSVVVPGISSDCTVPECQSVLVVWYDGDDDLSSFPVPWFDNGEMRLYLL